MITPILYTYLAKLNRVIDADTIVLEIDRGFKDYSIKTIRLARIDAPEIKGENKAEGIKAKEWVEETLKANPKITIQSLKLDGFGRAIAEVWYWVEKEDRWVNLNDRLVDLNLPKT